jgi:hypothetical protein
MLSLEVCMCYAHVAYAETHLWNVPAAALALCDGASPQPLARVHFSKAA